MSDPIFSERYEATMEEVRRAYPALLEAGVSAVAGHSLSSLVVMAKGSPSYEPSRYSPAEVRLARALLVTAASALSRPETQTQPAEPTVSSLALSAAYAVLSHAHPVEGPHGGESWRLQADRTEISHVLELLRQSVLLGSAVRVYGLTELSAIEGQLGGTEVCCVAQWAADEIDGVKSALLVVLP